MITVAQVKSFCGITDSSQDAAIATYIPLVEAVVRNITRNRYNLQVDAIMVSGSKNLQLSSIASVYGVVWQTGWNIDDIAEYIEDGATVTGTGVPSGAYVSGVFAESIGGRTGPIIELSAPATESGVYQLVFGIPVSLLPVMAKGVMWYIANQTTSPINAGWKSRSMGPLSVELGQNTAIDNRYGMPVWFVSAFPHFHGGH